MAPWSGDTEGRARKGRSTAAPPPLGGRSGGYNQAGCGEQHPRRALLAGLLLPAARGVVVIGLGLVICLRLHAPTRQPLREESAAVAVL